MLYRLGLIILAVVMHLQLAATDLSDVPPRQETQTYVRDLCRYTITLPSDWKTFDGKNDHSAMTDLIHTISGPKIDADISSWCKINEKSEDAEVLLIITGIVPSGNSFSRFRQGMEFGVKDMLEVKEKGTSILDGHKSYWYRGPLKFKTPAYGQCILLGKKNVYHFAMFFSNKPLTETQLTNYETIINTFRYLDN